MSISTYYRYAVWLPILLPLSLLPFFFPVCGGDFSKLFFPLTGFDLAGVITFLLGSLAWGGIPYLLTLAINCKTLLGDNYIAQSRVIWTLPLQMVPVLFACIFLYFDSPLFTGPGWKQPSDFLNIIYFFTGAATLVLGYLYIFAVQIVLRLLQHQGLVAPMEQRYIVELRSQRSRFTDQ